MVDLKKKIKEMLAEDIASGDITSNALLKSSEKARGVIVAKQACVLAGAVETVSVFSENGVFSEILVEDGSSVKPGMEVIRVEGTAKKIFGAERVALNLLMRMSGIATATKEMVEKARGRNPKIRVSATRKTAPLLTYLDKRAVIIAGGEPHRYNLSEQILIKVNHLKIVGSIEKAVKMAKATNKGKVEVEVAEVEDVVPAAQAGADIILLDNMTPSQVRRAVRLLERKKLRDKVLLEASGGITLKNIGDFAATGVDVVSSSYMTMKAPAIDMGMKITGKA